MRRPKFRNDHCCDIIGIHAEIRGRIEERIRGFRAIWKEGGEGDVFTELVFCILTPQTRARQGEKAVRALTRKGLIFRGSPEELAAELNIVRFRNRKAEYIVRARERFTREGGIILKKTLRDIGDPREMREFLSARVDGMGLKEASHFLRNIGLGRELAILDRHILKNLALTGCIDGVPASLSPARYYDYEGRMTELARTLGIPLEHLDFVLWYRETGDIYK